MALVSKSVMNVVVEEEETATSVFCLESPI